MQSFCQWGGVSQLLINSNQLKRETIPMLAVLIRTTGRTHHRLTCAPLRPNVSSRLNQLAEAVASFIPFCKIPTRHLPWSPSPSSSNPHHASSSVLLQSQAGRGGVDTMSRLRVWVSRWVRSLSGHTDLLVRGEEASLHSPSFYISSACCWG